MASFIPVAEEPEANMIEPFLRIDTKPLPGKAFCPPEQIDAALAQREEIGQSTKNVDEVDGAARLLVEAQMQQQQ